MEEYTSVVVWNSNLELNSYFDRGWQFVSMTPFMGTTDKILVILKK